MSTAEEIRNMKTTEVLELYRVLQAERKELVAKAGHGRASPEDLNRYMQVRRAMQPLHMSLICRGYDVNHKELDQ